MPSVHFEKKTKKPAELVHLKPERSELKVIAWKDVTALGIFFWMFLISKSCNWAGDAVAEKSRMSYS